MAACANSAGSSSPATPLVPGTHLFNKCVTNIKIVSTANLGCKLDLKSIALKTGNVICGKTKKGYITMKIRKPQTTARIYSSGKIKCFGAKTEEESRIAARRYARIIQKRVYEHAKFSFKIKMNIIGYCDVKFPIQLEVLKQVYPQLCSDGPKGLIYHMVNPRIEISLMNSGKVEFRGAKVRQELYEAFNNIYPILKTFKKQSSKL